MLGDPSPVFDGGETVVCDEDGLHFFEVAVAVEGSVSAEEEVGYDAYCPDIDWFAVAGLFEDFWRHVAWCAAGCG